MTRILLTSIFLVAGFALHAQHTLSGLPWEVVITAKTEVAQNVPISLSVLRGETVDRSGAFNVNRLKELIPSVQLYSTNQATRIDNC